MVPRATYRLQFSPEFTFRHTIDIIDYLNDLGVSDIYASPILKSRSGSTHGYDVIDPAQIDEQIGGQAVFEDLNRMVKERGMGWVQDIVPNHMAYHPENFMLMDVLENGPNSKYINYFDINWDYAADDMRGKVLAPFLGEFYGDCIDKDAIKLTFDQKGLSISYYEWVFPLRIESYVKVFSYDLIALENSLGRTNDDLIKFLEMLQVLTGLSGVTDENERYRQILLAKAVIWKLNSEQQAFKEYFENMLRYYNDGAGDPESRNRLDGLMSEQRFRLSFWKVGNEELNYRRFFTINGLICLKMEDPAVFAGSHALILKLVREGKITGLRIDHVDGLLAPGEYLKRLRQEAPEAYMVVEKILDSGEDLPSTWPVNGTTGYDFLNLVNGLFVYGKSERKINKAYDLFTDLDLSYEELVSDKKRLFMGKHMAGDIDNMAQIMKKIVSRNRYGKDFTMYGLRRAIVEIMAHFPVYRTYVNDEGVTEPDKRYILEATNKAKQKSPSLLYEINFIEKMLLMDHHGILNDDVRDDWMTCVRRFQQISGPLMAKGAEDTTFYIYNRLLSLNEVGGKPSRFGMTVKEYHEFNKKRSMAWPHSMCATSTHDTKRGEDARARISVISEIPDEWAAALKAWNKMNRGHKKQVGSIKAPDKNDECLLYQTLIGVMPFSGDLNEGFAARIKEYTIKAIREAKIHTAWLKPDTDYEEACLAFVTAILKESDNNPFPGAFKAFQKKIAFYGVFNSLSQCLLKLTSPGVPDIYQGSELWDLNLVDPDNRKPVDFARRKGYLSEIKSREGDLSVLLDELYRSREDGRIKQYLIYRVLSARRRNAGLFESGEYIPLEVKGPMQNNIVAFARRAADKWAVIMAGRFFTQVLKEGDSPAGRDAWKETVCLLPDGGPVSLRNVVTGHEVSSEGAISAGDVFTHIPVALLINE